RPGAPGVPAGPWAGEFAAPGLARRLAQLSTKVGRVELLTLVTLLPDGRNDRTAWLPGGERDMWFIVRTAAPYSRRAILMSLWPDTRIQRRTYRGLSYFTGPTVRVGPAKTLPSPTGKRLV